MADFLLAQNSWPIVLDADPLPVLTSGWLGINLWTIGLGIPPTTSVPITIYKMRGMDAVTNGTYDTWLATGEPDTDGSGYAGPLAKPLRDIVVTDSWPEETPP